VRSISAQELRRPSVLSNYAQVRVRKAPADPGPFTNAPTRPGTWEPQTSGNNPGCTKRLQRGGFCSQSGLRAVTAAHPVPGHLHGPGCAHAPWHSAASPTPPAWNRAALPPSLPPSFFLPFLPSFPPSVYHKYKQGER
jgi:hypothetical protein